MRLTMRLRHGVTSALATRGKMTGMTRSSSHVASLGQRPANDLPAQLAVAWPRRAWADVHVLAAVSGGGDSMALLRALVAAQQAVDGAGIGRIFAAHVNHGLRGKAADDAGKLVQIGLQLFLPSRFRQFPRFQNAG